MPNNIEMLQTVANGLEELKKEVVFVGGAVAELYANDPAASDIRPTTDVDCVIELSSRTSHAKLEEDLRAKGFKNDTSSILYYLYLAGHIKQKAISSDEAFDYFGIKVEGRHTAIGDAIATAKLFTKLLYLTNKKF